MRIGCARISATDQTLALQHGALKQAGCGKVFTDHGVSGSATGRSGLDRAMTALKKGGALVVWKPDRGSHRLLPAWRRPLPRWVGAEATSNSIDITNAGGRLVLHMMAAPLSSSPA